MHPTNCLNCETLLTADDHYCPNCGQKTNTHRLTLKHIVHEFLHTFTHADIGFLGMMADLAKRPGLVAREYVEGKRKKYFSPFTFFILSIGILVTSTHFFHALDRDVQPDPRVVAQLSAPAKIKYLNQIERLNTGTHFIGKNLNTAAMLLLPFYAFLSWVFFRGRGYNYSELLVGYMLFQSFVSIMQAIFVVPWEREYAGRSLFLYGYLGFLILSSVYIGIAQYQFLKFKNRWMIVFTSFVSLLGWVIVFLTIVLALLTYIYRGNTGKFLSAVWHQYVA